ncbi:unnamed protein product, partial [Prorocentrum cordatum]
GHGRPGLPQEDLPAPAAPGPATARAAVAGLRAVAAEAAGHGVRGNAPLGPGLVLLVAGCVRCVSGSVPCVRRRPARHVLAGGRLEIRIRGAQAPGAAAGDPPGRVVYDLDVEVDGRARGGGVARRAGAPRERGAEKGTRHNSSEHACEYRMPASSLSFAHCAGMGGGAPASDRRALAQKVRVGKSALGNVQLAPIQTAAAESSLATAAAFHGQFSVKKPSPVQVKHEAEASAAEGQNRAASNRLAQAREQHGRLENQLDENVERVDEALLDEQVAQKEVEAAAIRMARRLLSLDNFSNEESVVHIGALLADSALELGEVLDPPSDLHADEEGEQFNAFSDERDFDVARNQARLMREEGAKCSEQHGKKRKTRRADGGGSPERRTSCGGGREAAEARVARAAALREASAGARAPGEGTVGSQPRPAAITEEDEAQGSMRLARLEGGGWRRGGADADSTCGRCCSLPSPRCAFGQRPWRGWQECGAVVPDRARVSQAAGPIVTLGDRRETIEDIAKSGFLADLGSCEVTSYL